MSEADIEEEECMKEFFSLASEFEFDSDFLESSYESSNEPCSNLISSEVFSQDDGQDASHEVSSGTESSYSLDFDDISQLNDIGTISSSSNVLGEDNKGECIETAIEFLKRPRPISIASKQITPNHFTPDSSGRFTMKKSVARICSLLFFWFRMPKNPNDRYRQSLGRKYSIGKLIEAINYFLHRCDYTDKDVEFLRNYFYNMSVPTPSKSLTPIIDLYDSFLSHQAKPRESSVGLSDAAAPFHHQKRKYCCDSDDSSTVNTLIARNSELIELYREHGGGFEVCEMVIAVLSQANSTLSGAKRSRLEGELSVSVV